MKKINKVLVVDDSESDYIIAEVAIMEYDPEVEVLHAKDGQEALDILDQLEVVPDVILLDINMPGMNGYEFLEVYMEKDYDSSIVTMLSTSDQDEDKERCLKYSFVNVYIVKPLEKEDLVTIEKFL